MTGRVVIVTGASSGLGFEVAKQLCDGGNDVVLASHDEEQTKAAIEKIKQKSPNALATHMQLDLSSLESVRKFVDEFLSTGKKLNVLVNCAGIKLNSSTRQRQYSADNFELTMAINHLGHFLLTNLLLSNLKNTVADGGDARIIVVSSALHDSKTGKQCRNLQPLDIDNLFLFNNGSYSPLQAYKNSRAANLMFAYELARHVNDSGIKVCAVCPSCDPSSSDATHWSLAEIFMRCLSAPESPEHGASTICAIITDEKFKDVTGKYLKDGEEVQSSEETLNEETQAALWQASARYVRLDGYEPLEVTRPAAEDENEPKKEKKAKKTKKDKNQDNSATAKPAEEENLIIENGHGTENGKEGEEKKDECNDEETKMEETEKLNVSLDVEGKTDELNGELLNGEHEPVTVPCKVVESLENAVQPVEDGGEDGVPVIVENGISNGNCETVDEVGTDGENANEN
jgi:NAD(P)-dependent dehydrogenase (short-subunit alcohol dehydrogenase family)